MDDNDIKIPFKKNNMHDTSLGTSLEENLELDDSELGEDPGPLVSNNLIHPAKKNPRALQTGKNKKNSSQSITLDN